MREASKCSLFIFWAFLLMFFVSACNSSKKLLSSNKPVTLKTVEDFHRLLESRNQEFEWFSAKANVSADGMGMMGSGQMHLRLRKDSLSWMSFRKFTFEAFRVFATSTSYTYMDRFMQEYSIGTLNEIEEYTGVGFSFQTLQEILVGNMVVPESSRKLHDFQCNAGTCTASGSFEGLTLVYTLEQNSGKLLSVNISDTEGRTSRITYDQYSIFGKNGRVFPSKVNILAFPGTPDESRVDINFTSIEVNVPVQMNTSIPGSYDETK